MVFINYIILKILERDNTEITKVIDIAKVNQQPSPGKLIRFGKPIYGSRINNKDKRPKGIYWQTKASVDPTNNFINTKQIRKYRSPYEADYNKENYKRSEVIIFAKPHKATAYLFYTKATQRLYFGVTDSSFTFHPNEQVCLYTKELNSLEEVPILIQIDMVNGKNNIKKISKDNRCSPIRTVILNYFPRIFSEFIDYRELDSGIPGVPPDNYNIQFPATGFNVKKLLKKWLEYKAGIPRQIPITEIAFQSNALLPRGNVATNRSTKKNKGKEPEDVQIQRHHRSENIERYLDEYLKTAEIPQQFTLDSLPEPDENGYISFSDSTGEPEYDPMNPAAMFNQFKQGDNGDPVYFAINGKIKRFSTFDSETKAEPNEYIFYWCPTDSTYGIRFKKNYEKREKEDDNQEGDGEGGSNEQDKENEPAPIVNKYICISVLGNSGTVPQSIDYNPMVPHIIDFYTTSYFYLGRLSYDMEDINKKEQKALLLSDLKKRYFNYKNNNVASTSN